MQRRTTKSSSSNTPSLPTTAISPRSSYGGSKDRRGTTPLQALIYGMLFVVVLATCASVLLTPSQMHELQTVEQKVEQWVEEEVKTANEMIYSAPQPEKEKDPVESQKQKDMKEPKKEESKPHPLPDKDESANENADTKSSRWVEGEKKLKQKLRVLFDQQAKGDYLAAPVLTRYLGEDIPAFVGTPDVTMQEDEWKKLVEAKYQEMREEEDAWQKKMAAFIETQPRNPGITTP